MNPRIRNTINNKLEEDLQQIMNLRSCNMCTHQPVCMAFGMFKQNIEPNVIDQNTTLKAENLAKFCNLYQEKGLE